MKSSENTRLARYRKIFRRFLISYLFILVLPILIGSIAYQRAVHIITQNAVDGSHLLLKQSADVFDAYLRGVDLKVYTLSTDPSVQAILNMPQPKFGSDNVYELMQAIRSVRNSNISSTFDSTTYLFLEASDIVLTGEYANYGIKDYVETFMTYEGMSYKQWNTRFLVDKNDKTIIPAHRIISTTTGGGQIFSDQITYLQSIPQGAVVITIGIDEVAALLDAAVESTGGYAAVIDSNGKIIAGSTGVLALEDSELLFLNALEHSSSQMSRIDDTLIITYGSDYKNLTYICLLPVKGVLGEAALIRNTVLAIVAATLMVGAMVAFILSRRNSRPIAQIVASLGVQIPDEKGEVDEYRFIQGNITRLISTNHELRTSLEDHENAMKTLFIGQLLGGLIHNESEALLHAEQFGVTLFGKYHVVFIISYLPELELSTPDSGALLEQRVFRLVADSVLLRHLGNSGFTHMLESEEIAVVMNLKAANLESCQSNVESFISTVEEEFASSLRVRLRCGIGGFHEGLLDISRSFSEARIAMRHLPKSTASKSMVWFDYLERSEKSYYYPLEIEQKIMNLARNGKESELENILKSVLDENLNVRLVSPDVRNELLLEIRSTLSKLDSELETDFRAHGPDAPGFDDTLSPDYVERLCSALLRVAKYVREQRTILNHEQISKVTNYLENNYSDINISVYGFASDHNMSPSQFSKYFKEQTGNFFSDYLERIRLEHACELLRNSDMAIEQISATIGYNSAYSFRRAFKRVLGVTPSEYRPKNSLG